MTEKHLHIITHDVPWPADFGGVVDLFFKIKTLSEAGIKIHLHCFVNQRPPQEELNKYCYSVHYYQRKPLLSSISLSIPLIVNSRKSGLLEDNLLKDNHPILIEGIHCCSPVLNNQFNGRLILLRLHNVEFEYYNHLARLERNLFKKTYFKIESTLLKKLEKKMAAMLPIIAVSEKDVALYQQQFHTNRISYLPVFIPYTELKSLSGKGCFCLYHGNLSINENEQAAIWLLENVFHEIKIPFVIAGRNPSEKLTQLAHQQNNTCLVANPGDKEMQDLIGKAQINILPSLNNTGVKLKLLNALFNGRHCLVNDAGVAGSGLNDLCHIANGAEAFKQAVTNLYEQPFNNDQLLKRQNILLDTYNNNKTAEKLIQMIFNDQSI